jgi:HAD superfamily hydrolase (TIGR01549 family)
MPNIGEIELVVLDVGGVLRDSKLAINESYKLGFESVSLPYNFDAVDVWHLRGTGKYNDQQLSIKALFVSQRKKTDLHELLERDNSEGAIDELIRINFKEEDEETIKNIGEVAGTNFNSEAMKKFVKLCDGAMDGIDALIKKGYKIAIFSNAGRKSIERDIPNAERFSAIMSEADVKNKKPSGEGIIKICDILKISPKNTVYVGDSPTDIEAARDAGCYAVGVLTGMGTRQKIEKTKPDWIFDGLIQMSDAFPLRR